MAWTLRHVRDTLAGKASSDISYTAVQIAAPQTLNACNDTVCAKSLNSLPETFWYGLGTIGAAIFYGRFYVQWIASELHRRSVIPVLFWYMSIVGSVLLLIFAFWSQSPLGALGQNVNAVVYTRNLIHIRREKHAIKPIVNWIIHLALVAAAAGALALVGLTWWNESQDLSGVASDAADSAWFWLGIGVLGQGLFAVRFLIQWIVTELNRKSTFPFIFWPLSVVAALLQGACFFQRQEWIFAVGTMFSIGIYLRNMWFIRAGETKPGDVQA